MSHGAQCMLCAHAQWRGNTVIACLAFEHDGLPSNTYAALTAFTFRAAATAPCPVRWRVHVGPDAYLAQDLPTKD